MNEWKKRVNKNIHDLFLYVFFISVITRRNSKEVKTSCNKMFISALTVVAEEWTPSKQQGVR